ncbi:MAG: hypothetical protein QNJ98_18505 [Planctomycetota bacterium]|nr:hypothetical protein [Planctomycetota bacterium]
MTFILPPTRTQAFFAYLLSTLTTLLWVGCVIPAGTLADTGLLDDFATPIHREAILLVPALLLLTVLPVGFTLSRREEGVMSVLASTDAFVAFYAGIALLAQQPMTGPAAVTAIALLFSLGGLSTLEALRAMRAARDTEALVPRKLRGARLALCVLVLMVPPQFLLEEDTELASWLGPFLFVAVSAAGAAFARSGRGLRFTAAILQLLLAVHVAITLRWTLLEPDGDASIQVLRLPGEITLALAGGVLLVALLQCLVLLPGLRKGSGEAARETVG